MPTGLFFFANTGMQIGVWMGVQSNGSHPKFFLGNVGNGKLTETGDDDDDGENGDDGGGDEGGE